MNSCRLRAIFIFLFFIDHEVIKTWPKENDKTIEQDIGTENRLKNGYFPNPQETKVTLRQHSRVKRAVSTYTYLFFFLKIAIFEKKPSFFPPFLGWNRNE